MPTQHPIIPLHPTMEDHLSALVLTGRLATASQRRMTLRAAMRWFTAQGIDPLAATTEQLLAYQASLTTATQTRIGHHGEPLGRGSQCQRMLGLKAYYRWLHQRGQIVVDPARTLRMRMPRSRVVVRQHLSLQEATALLQTQAAQAASHGLGSRAWATEIRTLALLCIALATGRRRSGLCRLRVDQIDLARQEIRVEHEKGNVGRVLPVIGWAVAVLRLYLEQARPVLVGGATTPWLFPGRDPAEPISAACLWNLMQDVVTRAVDHNPDLDELPGKRITWHSLRVSFATLLFQNGCDIRSVNELLLHRLLSTTAQYTPIPVEDLRQVCRTAHPRA